MADYQVNLQAVTGALSGPFAKENSPASELSCVAKSFAKECS
jgi:hypothetical protein